MNISGYRIEEQIGQGGMAMVYRAVQESLNRPVALKVMNPLYSDSPEFSKRFLDEGRLLASVHHTNIITIHDIGISAGLHFISMEYVQGGDLGGRIRAGITPVQATQYVKSLAGCLRVAHDAHIVHRDIKPANVLFRKDGTLLLTDFGIAKQLTADKGLTVTGSMVGSPHYLSPEQAKGRPVDGRADIYSLGIIYYEMLTGTRPFTGDSDVDVAIKHVTEPMPVLPEALAAYRGIVDRMTRKDPEERFPSCGSLLEALSELVRVGTWSGEVKPIALPAAPEPEALTADAGPDRPRETPPVPTDPAPAGGGTLVEGTRADATLVLDPATLGEIPDTTADPVLSARQRPLAGPDGRTRWFLGGGIAGTALLALLVGSLLHDGVETRAPERAVAQPVPAEAGTAITKNATGERRTREEIARPAREEKIAELVRDAETALAEYRLTTPEEDNAYGYYRQVLALDPENAAARQGLVAIADAYYELARRAESRWDYDRARHYVDSGLEITPEYERLLELRQALAAKENTTEGAIKKSLKGVKRLFD